MTQPIVITLPSSCSLTSSRKRKRLSHGHLWHVHIILSDVCCTSLWHKLIHPMPIVSLITFSEESSCPAKADNKEVLPEPFCKEKYRDLGWSNMQEIQYALSQLLRRNLPLSFSTTLTSLPISRFLSSDPMLLTSISFSSPGPSSSRRPWLMRRHIGILSMATHLLSLPSPSLLRFPLLVISSISMSA